ncbi:hypothetical protein MTO96_006221 [Rhipicephalus appendiculatus]
MHPLLGAPDPREKQGLHAVRRRAAAAFPSRMCEKRYSAEIEDEGGALGRRFTTAALKRGVISICFGAFGTYRPRRFPHTRAFPEQPAGAQPGFGWQIGLAVRSGPAASAVQPV